MFTSKEDVVNRVCSGTTTRLNEIRVLAWDAEKALVKVNGGTYSDNGGTHYASPWVYLVEFPGCIRNKRIVFHIDQQNRLTKAKLADLKAKYGFIVEAEAPKAIAPVKAAKADGIVSTDHDFAKHAGLAVSDTLNQKLPPGWAMYYREEKQDWVLYQSGEEYEGGKVYLETSAYDLLILTLTRLQDNNWVPLP